MNPRDKMSNQDAADMLKPDELPDGGPGSVVRREPFSDNPRVGARGQRTQQLILDAALRVFGERGYHPTKIDRITRVAGCSRASFYQYFSSKEDVFRHLTGQVARQLSASIEMLGPVTGDADGWASIRAWVSRYAEIYERYEPVFKVFQAAAMSDEAIIKGMSRVSERHVASFRARLPATLPPRQLDPVINLLLASVPRTLDNSDILRAAAPESYAPERIHDAISDIVHRTLFGLIADVNVHSPPAQPAPALHFSQAMQDALQRDDSSAALNAAGRRTFQALLQAGRDVFVARGYHRTRIDDVVAAAGVSHGAFYRYFTSKDQFAYLLAVRAIRTVSEAFVEMPEALVGETVNSALLRNWLRRYNTTQSSEMAMIRVWVDVAFQDPDMTADSAATLDWGRRRVRRFLQPRDFGDVDTEAVAMIALLSAFGLHEQSATAADAAGHIIEAGLLGR